MNSGLVMYEEEFRQIAGICDRLTRDANAKVVFLVDKNGQLIASSGQAQNLDTTSLSLTRPDGYDIAQQRYPLRSYGFGLRLNLFNYAIMRWDYAIPVDQNGHRGVWTWSLWPSF